jgi:hypothetical protein
MWDVYPAAGANSAAPATGRNTTLKIPHNVSARTQGPRHSLVITLRAGKTPAAADTH